jgi:hypothetical protein
MIPFVGFNATPGKLDAMPYWKAPVERRRATKELSDSEKISQFFRSKGVIEVTVQP